MKFRVVGNFTNGLGWFKKGDVYQSDEDVAHLIRSKLIEPLEEASEEDKPKKPRRKKPDGLRDSE